MTRKCAYLQWALLAALVVGWSVPASAQTAGTTSTTGGTGATNSGAPGQEDGNITVNMVSAGGKPFSEQQRTSKPINLQACTQGEIEVTLSGVGSITAQFPYLEVWYSTGSGACQQGDRATRVTGSQNCTKLDHSKKNAQLSGQTIFNTVVDIQPVCQLDSTQTQGLDGPKTLYFLLLSSQGSTETAQFYRAFTIKVDTTPPDPPEITTAGIGQTDIQLDWTLPTTSTGFWVVADYSQGALGMVEGDAGLNTTPDGGTGKDDSNCPSNILIGGKELGEDVMIDGLFRHELLTPMTEYSFNGQDFKGATNVPVAVIAKDLAGNLSKMSAVRCLTVTKTTGFWKRYRDDGGTAEPGCACSVPGAKSGRPSAVTAIPVALLLAGVLARRRIRRRAR